MGLVTRVRRSLLMMRGRWLYRLGVVEGAARAFRSLADLAPDDAGELRLVARLLAACEDHEGRLAVEERLVAIDPDEITLRARVACLHLGRGDYERARPLLERLVELRPQQASHRAALGEVYLKLGRLAQAREALTAALGQRLDRNVVRWMYKVAQIQSMRGEHSEARRTYEAILRYDATDPVARTAVVRTHLAAGDVEAARRAHDVLLSSDAELGGALAARIKVATAARDCAVWELVLQGRRDDIPKRMLISTPDGPLDALVPRALVSHIHPVLSLDEQRRLREQLIERLLEAGIHDRALFHLNQVRSDTPAQEALTQARKGIALLRLGRRQAARAELTRMDPAALAADGPSRLSVLYDAGHALLHVGEPVRATAVFKRILLRDITFRDTQDLVRQLSDAAPGGPDERATRVLGEASAGASSALAVGRYLLREPLAAGFMGDLFIGTDPQLGRTVVLRRLPPSVTGDARTRARFLEQARHATRFAGPHLAAMLDVVETTDGGAWLVAEHAPGKPLSAILEAPQAPDSAWALEVALQAARGLAPAHAAGVLHGDLGPSSIICAGGPGPHGREASPGVKVVDLGLSMLSNSLEVAPAAYLQGRADLMAPEFIRGERCDVRADVYALGIVLYRMMAGRFPFCDADLYARLYRYLETPIPPPSAHGAPLSRAVEDLIMECLARDRTRRPSNAASLAARLESILEGKAP